MTPYGEACILLIIWYCYYIYYHTTLFVRRVWCGHLHTHTHTHTHQIYSRINRTSTANVQFKFPIRRFSIAMFLATVSLHSVFWREYGQYTDVSDPSLLRFYFSLWFWFLLIFSRFRISVLFVFNDIAVMEYMGYVYRNTETRPNGLR